MREEEEEQLRARLAEQDSPHRTRGVARESRPISSVGLAVLVLWPNVVRAADRLIHIVCIPRRDKARTSDGAGNAEVPKLSDRHSLVGCRFDSVPKQRPRSAARSAARFEHASPFGRVNRNGRRFLRESGDRIAPEVLAAVPVPALVQEGHDKTLRRRGSAEGSIDGSGGILRYAGASAPRDRNDCNCCTGASLRCAFS
jgi:hypothetical protein